MSKLLSFIIPCYRSEKTIDLVVDEIVDVLREKPSYDYEIICVNDFSPDDVYQKLKSLSLKNYKIKTINLSKNMGKHAAIMAGYAYAKGDYIVNLDDDFQCPMNELWRLLDPVEKDECDLSTAKYYGKKRSAWKRFGSNFFYLTSRIVFNKPVGLRFENFSVMKKFVMNEIINYKNPYPNLEGLVLRVTHNIIQVKMKLRDRADDNATGFTFFKNISLWLSSLTSFSIKPLRVSIFIGVLFAFLGFAYGLFIVIKKLIIGPAMPTGFPSILSSILFSSGIIMILLGIIGEYVGRIYISLNAAPQFVVKDTINIKSEQIEHNDKIKK